MNWYQEVAQYIEQNLDNFVDKFFGDEKIIRYHKGFYVNPSPCCGHNDCFSIAKNQNGFKCFSCGEKGTRIQSVELTLGQDEARKELEDWTGIQYSGNAFDDKRQAEHNKEKRIQDIQNKAIEHYKQNLLNDRSAYTVQLAVQTSKGHRSHTKESLSKFNVGLSGNYKEFHDAMIAKGYTVDEVKEAGKLIWAPEGYFVYPYYDMKGVPVRINTKLHIRRCKGKKNKDGTHTNDCSYTLDIFGEEGKMYKEIHERDHNHEMFPDGFSRGDRVNSFYFAKNSMKNKKKLILVEGENDVISVDEELVRMPKAYRDDFAIAGLGGNPDDEAFDSPFLRQFEAIYEIFDHDDAGDGYRKKLNEQAPDIPVYSVKFDEDYSDIDALLKASEETLYEEDGFKGMLDSAVFVDSKEFIIERDGHSHTWILKNRKFQLTFAIENFNRNANQLEGTLSVYKNGQITDRKTGGLDKIRVDTSIQYAKLKFSEQLNTYYNEVLWLKDKPKRDLWELMDIAMFSKEYFKIIKQIAWYLYNADKKRYALLVKQIQKKFNQQIAAEILQEVNGFDNIEVDANRIFPRISLSQFFHPTNNDAYFYFSKLVTEGDTPRLVPCLISNHKEEIRLDLLKRKDPQCLLLINKKYELPFEVATAVMDPIEVSLQPYWVSKWQNDELDPESYDPKRLIQEIEAFVRQSYHMQTDAVKVLALWIYATYFYMLFTSGFPYLIFTGAKGSGKSTLDTILYLLSLNAKFALDMTESALFRTISFEGGTFILDEVENLTDKNRVDNNGYAKILKGGYADLAYVYRTNMDKGVTERFSVFGPKVISNINGIEDVIGDRCIFIKTFSATEDKLKGLTDPQIFKMERRAEVHSITSRCAISALNYFQDVKDIFYNMDSRMETGNARLTQILRPLLTMARFVGGDYEEHLLRFYEREIKHVKDEIAAGTVEGMIKNVLKRVAEELTGVEKEKWATDYNRHLYDAPIKYSENLGTFELDTLHLKILVEELSNNESIDIKTITGAMKNVLGADFDFSQQRKRTMTTITDESLIKHLGDKRTMRTYRYYLNIKDFLDPITFKMISTKATEGETLF